MPWRITARVRCSLLPPRPLRLPDAREVFLETELSNTNALSLYLKLGFLKDRRYYHYYLNGSDAWRLMLHLDHSKPKAKA